MAGMRSIFNLNVSLGMFGFAVKGYKAINDPTEEISFRQIHAKCGHPINHVKHCHTCQAPVEQSEILKGIANGPGFLTFTEAEIKDLKPESAGTITIEGYIADDGVDPIYQDGSVYYLAPDGKDPTTFTTFRDALGSRLAIGKVVLYGRERVVTIRRVERLLALSVVRTTGEIRDIHNVPKYDAVPAEGRTEYVAMMNQLMDQSTVDFESVVIESDAYVQAVKALIEARKNGQPNPAQADVVPVASPTDLMAMLKASLAAKAA